MSRGGLGKKAEGGAKKRKAESGKRKAGAANSSSLTPRPSPLLSHMTKHFDRQIEKLKSMLLELGARVEESVEQAIGAIANRDADQAREVIRGDRRIDLMEIDVEEECLHTLALFQPMAADLRFVVSVVKINNDLERIADLAANLAEQALFLIDQPLVDGVPFDLDEESRRVRSMVKQSLDALVNNDLHLAEMVRHADQRVDAIHRAMYRKVKKAIRDNPDDVDGLIAYFNISRHLERIADHAVNVAEDVIYMVLGEIHRHERDIDEDADGRSEGTFESVYDDDI